MPRAKAFAELKTPSASPCISEETLFDTIVVEVGETKATKYVTKNIATQIKRFVAIKGSKKIEIDAKRFPPKKRT